MSFRRKPESRKILSMEEIRTVFWKDDSVVMIDQQALPLTERYVTCTDYREVIAAIKDLTVRGAPAIGVAAAMGIALGALHIEAETPAAFKEAFEEICQQFAASRPTARNLFWAIERMKRCFAAALPAGPETAADSAPGNGSKGTTAGTPGCVFPPPERCPRTDGPAPFPAPGDVHQHVIILKDNGNDPWRPHPGGPHHRGDPDRRRGCRHQPAPGNERVRADPGRRPDSHPLQRRCPCHGRLRHGPGGHPRHLRQVQKDPCLCRRDPPRPPGGEADRVGADAGGGQSPAR